MVFKVVCRQVASLENMFEKQILRPIPEPPESEPLGLGPEAYFENHIHILDDL